MALGELQGRRHSAAIRAPFRATAALTAAFAAASLLLAWIRIDLLQRFDPRWPAELHWAMEVISWPFVALLAGVVFAIAVLFRPPAADRGWLGAAFGAATALLICAPVLVGGQLVSPLASWLTWGLVLAMPVLAAMQMSGEERRP